MGTAVQAGVIKVSHEKDGWFSVAIGRERWTKRFWLSHKEARQLIDRLTEALGE
jgi:hypothetical protein